MNLPFLRTINSVGYLTEEKDIFPSLYLKVRTREKRVLEDAQVKELPFVPVDDPHYKEWILRQKSTSRFITYLKKKRGEPQILDVGCGNGWFSHQMALASVNNTVLGLDINRSELEQGARLFRNANLKFALGDIFHLKQPFRNRFDIITINASVQYFQDIGLLASLLKSFLKPSGEIHIIDSPFYSRKDVPAAQKRSEKYYADLGFPKMAKFYFHHCIDDLREFDVLYSPGKSIFHRIFKNQDSPFPWLRYSSKPART